jgi:hypothetical protein
MKKFIWVPGEGVDADALQRLVAASPRPREPMGEAWFMGDKREMFPELLSNLSNLTAFELQKPLSEIASGTSSFGQMDEWTNWFNYLLPRLLPRSHEHHVYYLLEYLVSGFIALYPKGTSTSPYKAFRQDVLLTLGRAIMDASCWTGNDIVVGSMLRRSDNNPNRVWLWWDASGDFTASMFFCLKYLPEELVHDWLMSALRIPSPHWRAQMVVWLVGAHGVLQGGVGWPSQLPGNAYPSVDWADSHWLRPELGPEFLSDQARGEALRALRDHMTPDVFLEWLDSINSISYLRDELAEIPVEFERLYVTS